MFYTYAHTKPDGTIFYIGKGTGVRAWKKTSRNPHWKNVVLKYKTYNVEILANWNTEKEALNHEILLISCFRDLGYKLVNMTDGGEGTSGLKMTEEVKQKISKALKGAKNWAYGKPKSKKVKQKIKESNLINALKGKKSVNFKAPILAINIQTGLETKFFGTAELEIAGFQSTNVYKCVNGKRKLHKGHIFKRLQK
jgi:hypothetical protein